jgi:endonuclease YncB( thermonuclease family)
MQTASILFRAIFVGLLLSGIMGAGLAVTGSTQTIERPAVRNVTAPARTQRLKVGDEFFKQEAVRFERARIDSSGVIRADGHNLNLYGVVLIPRNKICASAEGARWACGQRAFMALRALLDGQSITCGFKHVTVPPKAVCLLRDGDVAGLLLREGWAELADGVTEEAYVAAQEAAQTRKAGIWGDSPP